MNECSWIQKRYIKEKNLIIGNVLNIDEYREVVLNLEQYGDQNKGPDMISRFENKIYGIEHFEFDSTKNSSKGSNYKRQLANIDYRTNQEIIYKNRIKNITPLMLNQNLDNYIKSYKKSFQYHYSRINSYLESLDCDFPNYEKEIWFFVEDVTPLGNNYFDKNGHPQPFHPMLCLELVELLKKSPNINGIIFAVHNEIFFCKNENNEIDFWENECYDKNIKSLMIQNPLCITEITKTSL